MDQLLQFLRIKNYFLTKKNIPLNFKKLKKSETLDTKKLNQLNRSRMYFIFSKEIIY